MKKSTNASHLQLDSQFKHAVILRASGEDARRILTVRR